MFNVTLFSVDFDMVKTLNFDDFFDAVKFASRPEWYNAVLFSNCEKLAVFHRGELTVWDTEKFKF